MTKEERIKVYAALSAPFPDHAVERTEGRVTGRGYDTTGIKYQFIADRLNEVLGVGGFRTDRTITIKNIVSAKGRPGYEAIAEVRLELGEWINGEFVVFAQAWGDGGHIATNEADARKGSFTNAFKKAAGFMGAGGEAYRGTIDDDHAIADECDPPPGRSVVAVVHAGTPPDGVAKASNHVRSAPMGSPVNREHPVRDRLTSKQHSALRSLSRTTGYDDRGFREHVRQLFGVQPAFLSRAQASELIGQLIAQTNSEGVRKVS